MTMSSRASGCYGGKKHEPNPLPTTMGIQGPANGVGRRDHSNLLELHPMFLGNFV